MVKYNGNDELTSIFGALADPTRRAILYRLSDKNPTVTELAEPFEISLPAVSKHLKVLEDAGLILRRKKGRKYHFKPNVEPIKEAQEWIEEYTQFWERKLESLDIYLRKQKEVN